MQPLAKRIVQCSSPFMKTVFFLLPLVLAMAGARAQYVYDYKHTADVYYDKSDFYSAAVYYNKALTNKTVKNKEILPYAVEKPAKVNAGRKEYEQVVYRLAESYRKYNDYGNAEKWYAQAAAFKGNPFPLAGFYYALTLRANKKFDLAIQQFQTFRQNYHEQDDYNSRAELEIANCQFAMEQGNRKAEYMMSRLGGNINIGGANYAPLSMDPHTLYFTSSRPDTQSAKKKNPYVNNVWTASGQDSAFVASQKIDLPAARGTDQGAATITPDGNTMYLTRWNIINGVKITSIFIAQKRNNAWSDPIALDNNVNAAGYNSMQPNVSTDGKYLLFVSNRPGGMGKNDIWYCAIREDGTLDAARNMGTIVNSREEDQAPYYNSKTKMLIFSSSGRVGLGGLDFFSCFGNFGSWTAPVNLGTPFNSAKDDIYFSPVDAAKPMDAGFISTDRESVCCLELFAFQTLKKPKVNMLGGGVTDCDTHQPLSGVRVSLVDTATNAIIQQVTVDETGQYLFTVEMKKRYKVLFEKANYFTKAMYSNTDALEHIDSMYNPGLCLKHFEIGKAIVLKDIYYDFNKANLRDESKGTLDSVVQIMNDNRDITVEMSAHTDSKGKDAYNLKLSQARAQSCVDYLISKGIPTSRLIARGYGKTRPIAPNTLPNGKDNPDGRQLNRRTEFKVLSTTVLLK